MQIGLIGLDRMGGNIARRVMRAGHQCIVFDTDVDAREELVKEGAKASTSLAELVRLLRGRPRAVWMILPAGQVTEDTVNALSGLLKPNDVIVDGGNSCYRDDMRRAKKLAEKRIHYVDCGTSNSVWGVDQGYCMMIGGHKRAVDHLDPIFMALAPSIRRISRRPACMAGRSHVERGYIHAGPPGAGRFVKMVLDEGIE